MTEKSKNQLKLFFREYYRISKEILLRIFISNKLCMILFHIRNFPP
jgi:hypothetical protein